MSFSKQVWEQLKSKTKDDLITALLKDGFLPDVHLRTERIYRHPDGRKVSIHYHKGSDCFGRGLLVAVLADIGWSETYMRRLKFIK